MDVNWYLSESRTSVIWPFLKVVYALFRLVLNVDELREVHVFVLRPFCVLVLARVCREGDIWFRAVSLFR